MQILQFPDSSWGLTVLKNIFLRFIGTKGLKMLWKKSSLIWNFFPWFWLKNPCFSLISLTGKSLQNFPWIPWFPWSVGILPLYMKTVQWAVDIFIMCDHSRMIIISVINDSSSTSYSLSTLWFLDYWKISQCMINNELSKDWDSIGRCKVFSFAGIVESQQWLDWNSGFGGVGG